MQILIILLVAVLVYIQGWRIITILMVMKTVKKIPYNCQLIKLLPNEIPAAVQEAFAKISEVLRANHLEKVTDFRMEGLEGYYSLYRDDSERMYADIVCSQVKNIFSFILGITTYFTDGAMVRTTNIPKLPPPDNTFPNKTIRCFPDCMPEDLLRLHKEYITHQTPQPEKQKLPQDLLKLLEKENQESRDAQIKKGRLKRDKDEKYLKYSFLYLFSWVSYILKQKEGRQIKHPGLITHLPYARGFANWINPASPLAQEYLSPAPEPKKKHWLWRWEFFVPLLIILVFVYNNLQHKKDSASSRSDYSKYRQGYYQKLYTFGQVQVSPLTENLEKIQTWWETYYQPAARSLQPGLKPEQIRERLKDLPLTIPEDLYTLYTWHNGQQPTGPGAEFIPAYTFLSLDDALKTYREMRELSKTSIQDNEFWPPYYFPILSFEGSYYVVLCGGDKPGSVIERLLEDPEPGAAYPTIAFFIQEIAENYASGAYYIDGEGHLNTDNEKIQTVFKKYHPALPPRYVP